MIAGSAMVTALHGQTDRLHYCKERAQLSNTELCCQAVINLNENLILCLAKLHPNTHQVFFLYLQLSKVTVRIWSPDICP